MAGTKKTKPAKKKPAKKKPAKKPSSKPAVVEKFAGFDRQAMGFWHELAVEMNRAWFEENKARYERLWVAPMKALLGEVTAALRATYRPLELGEPKLLRIHRDVRFSKDKSPYKTHISGVITLAGKKLGDGGNAAMYLHVGVDEEFVGVGCYMFDSERLARWRKVVAGKQGPILAKLVGDLRAKGYVVGGHDDYKRVPKPYDDDHPQPELLKMKGLTGGFPEIPAGMLHQPELRDWLVEHGKAMRPVVAWLHEHIR